VTAWSIALPARLVGVLGAYAAVPTRKSRRVRLDSKRRFTGGAAFVGREARPLQSALVPCQRRSRSRAGACSHRTARWTGEMSAWAAKSTMDLPDHTFGASARAALPSLAAKHGPLSEYRVRTKPLARRTHPRACLGA
jgi:hypothetical protein